MGAGITLLLLGALLALSHGLQNINAEFNTKIAIINCPHQHVDVIAGVLHAFKPYIKDNQTHVYLNDFSLGTIDLLESGLGINLRKNGTLHQVTYPKAPNQYTLERPEKKDLIFFVSPEYPPFECREVSAACSQWHCSWHWG